MDDSNIYEYIKLQVEIFNKNYQKEYTRIKELNLPEETIIKIINGRYNYCNLPPELNKILITNQDDLLKFLNYIKTFIEKQYVKGKTNKRIEEKLSNKINSLNFNNIYQILLNWLLNKDFIENVINNSDFNIIDESDIPSPSQQLETFIPRVNQKEAIDRLYRNGLESGIHCQATGCGKTFIILAYIDYCIKNFNNCKIILFTERVSILRDLFDFVSKKSTEPNKEKIQEWKDLGIADLTKLKIINRVTIKKRDFTELLNNSQEPTMLVINRAFLTSRKIYQELDDISLILHDECHNTSSSKCHEFLLSQKEKKIPIVGFSATPLRTGKKDLPKLKEIYDQEEPLLTNYNMIYAIENNLILPPIFYWYQINNNNDDLNKNGLISKKEVITVLLLLCNIKKKMPNKKGPNNLKISIKNPKKLKNPIIKTDHPLFDNTKGPAYSYLSNEQISYILNLQKDNILEKELIEVEKKMELLKTKIFLKNLIEKYNFDKEDQGEVLKIIHKVSLQ